MDKETFRELIIEKMKSINLAYEDFIGYSYSDDPSVWMGNLNKIMPDTYYYSLLTNDEARTKLVVAVWKELAAAYKTLESEGQSNNEIS